MNPKLRALLEELDRTPVPASPSPSRGPVCPVTLESVLDFGTFEPVKNLDLDLDIDDGSVFSLGIDESAFSQPDPNEEDLPDLAQFFGLGMTKLE